MYFISRLWPHFLYFSCIYSIIWPNLCQDDLDRQILHLQNRSLSQSMPHSIILWFFAASSSSNSTSLTSTLSQNHGPSSGLSTGLVIFGRRLSETQYSNFDGWMRRIGRPLSRVRHIWQWWRCGRGWEGRPSQRWWWRQQDGACVHCTDIVIDFLNAKLHGRVISDHAQAGAAVADFQPFSLSAWLLLLGFRQCRGGETVTNEGSDERSGSVSQRRGSLFSHDEFSEKGGHLSHNGRRTFRICTRSI